MIRMARNIVLVGSLLWGYSAYREHQSKPTPVKDKIEASLEQAKKKREEEKKPLWKKRLFRILPRDDEKVDDRPVFGRRVFTGN